MCRICEISSFVVGKNPAEVISHLEVEAQRDKEKTMKEKTRYLFLHNFTAD